MTKQDVLDALNAERDAGDWWRRRCIESMELRERRGPISPPDEWDDSDTATARRRKALADEYERVAEGAA